MRSKFLFVSSSLIWRFFKKEVDFFFRMTQNEKRDTDKFNVSQPKIDFDDFIFSESPS